MECASYGIVPGNSASHDDLGSAMGAHLCTAYKALQKVSRHLCVRHIVSYVGAHHTSVHVYRTQVGELKWHKNNVLHQLLHNASDGCNYLLIMTI